MEGFLQNYDLRTTLLLSLLLALSASLLCGVLAQDPIGVEEAGREDEANREGVEAIVEEENEEGEDKSTMSTSGWIALGVCVGLAVLVIAGIAVCICRKNRRDQSRWKRGSSSSSSTRSPPQAEFGGGSIIKRNSLKQRQDVAEEVQISEASSVVFAAAPPPPQHYGLRPMEAAAAASAAAEPLVQRQEVEQRGRTFGYYQDDGDDDDAAPLSAAPLNRRVAAQGFGGEPVIQREVALRHGEETEEGGFRGGGRGGEPMVVRQEVVRHGE